MSSSPKSPTPSSADTFTLLPHGVHVPCGGHASLLDAALAAQLPVPFSCRRGACGSCAASIVDGRAFQAPGASADAVDPGPGRLLMCQSRAAGGLVLCLPDWVPPPAPERRQMRVLAKTALSTGVVQLLLHPGAPLATQAGQHLRVALGGGDHRCFSIANRRAQALDPIELQIRRVPGGRFSDHVLGALAAGAELDVEGPFGAVVPPAAGQPLVLLATGTGYAGVRALLQEALDDRAVPAITLYWGGRHDPGDHYARAELDAWCADDPRLRWTPVRSHLAHDASAGTAQHERPVMRAVMRPVMRHVQDHALAGGHDWTATRVHACGNPAMLRDARSALLAAGLPAERWHADAFVASGQAMAPHAWERTGPRFNRAGIVAARERSMAAVRDIAARLPTGITAADARELADQRLRAMGALRNWHPTIVRFGADTSCGSRERGDPTRRLRPSDILFIDIGPVWDGYEGDYGDTFVRGDDPVHLRCAAAARAVFSEAADAWRAGADGVALYALAERAAERHGCVLVREMAGHRVADFPHALYGKHKLAEAGFAPAEGLWVLEIQLRDREQPVGAFFEDVLLRDAATSIAPDVRGFPGPSA